MSKKMLIDATHAEETRVVVVDGNRVEEFDFETVNKRQIAGNIYLAKVTRVEPSLQAAFVDYGGNRHGFLAFAEIHPDYYQIPIEDRKALIEEERALNRAEEEEDNRRARNAERAGERSRDAGDAGADAEGRSGEGRSGEGRGSDGRARDDRRGRSNDRGRGRGRRTDGRADTRPDSLADSPADGLTDGSAPLDSSDAAQVALEPTSPDLAAQDSAVETQITDANPQSTDAADGTAPSADAAGQVLAAATSGDAVLAGPVLEHALEPVAADAPDYAAPLRNAASPAGMEVVDLASETAPDSADHAPHLGHSHDGDHTQDHDHSLHQNAEPSAFRAIDHASDSDDDIESIAEEDIAEEISAPRRPRARRYKIQEVVKVRQIMLVQVVKEERGNKGAALTTYLSLAGRYCVLMPNTARGGGISRKIVQAADRKKLKEIAQEIEVPEGAGLIIRTAGAKRTKPEIKRDYEYLMRLWEQIRELTLKSMAPAAIYEEGDLIKRTIRDLYSSEIDEILVEGEAGYRTAKDFMRMIMPAHAKQVVRYTDPTSLFARYQVESYLGGMFNPTVQLKSGGYIVIGITEALVAIDVNSGRATKEGSIEDTALKTNLEAAEEVARQLRLRDLAGLIVIDFIDMEERRNNLAVEKRLKDRLKTDRARIQVGRISGFGLMEMSRQRLRPGMLESTTQPCAHCHGTGLIRSDDSLGLQVLRALEEEGVRKRSREVLLRAPIGIVNFLINQKREHIALIEARTGMSVRIECDPAMISPDFTIEKFKTATRLVSENSAAISGNASLMGAPVAEDYLDDAEVLDEAVDDAIEASAAPAARPEAAVDSAGDAASDGGKKRRRRRRRKPRVAGDAGGAAGSSDDDQDGDGDDNGDGEEGESDASDAPEEGTSDAAAPAPSKAKRTRAPRGGKKADVVLDAAVSDMALEPETAADAVAEAFAASVQPMDAAPAKPARGRTRAKAAPAADDGAPAKPARSRAKGKDAAQPQEDTAPAPAPEAPVAPAPVQDAEPAPVAQPQSAQPEVAPIKTPPEAPPEKPRKKGWWNLG